MASPPMSEARYSHASHFRHVDTSAHPAGLRPSEAIRIARTIEQSKNPYKVDRRLDEYLYDFLGLQAGMSYVNDVLPSKVVTELGIGNGVALQKLADLCRAQQLNLTFKGTGLRQPNQVQALRERGIETRLTAFERMRGFEPGSVGAFLAYYSLPYVTNPERVAHVLDTLLCPGGFIKAIFPAEASAVSRVAADGNQIRLKAYPSEAFAEVFEALGYKVARKTIVHPGSELEVLFALKPSPHLDQEAMATVAQKISFEPITDVLNDVQQLRQL